MASKHLIHVDIFVSSICLEMRSPWYRVSRRRVILIDGTQLVELMCDEGIGVSIANSYLVKRLDSDFFDDDEIMSGAMDGIEE